jgi:hypothetical protein
MQKHSVQGSLNYFHGFGFISVYALGILGFRSSRFAVQGYALGCVPSGLDIVALYKWSLSFLRL